MSLAERATIRPLVTRLAAYLLRGLTPGAGSVFRIGADWKPFEVTTSEEGSGKGQFSTFDKCGITLHGCQSRMDLSSSKTKQSRSVNTVFQMM